MSEFKYFGQSLTEADMAEVFDSLQSYGYQTGEPILANEQNAPLQIATKIIAAFVNSLPVPEGLKETSNYNELKNFFVHFNFGCLDNLSSNSQGFEKVTEVNVSDLTKIEVRPGLYVARIYTPSNPLNASTEATTYTAFLDLPFSASSMMYATQTDQKVFCVSNISSTLIVKTIIEGSGGNSKIYLRLYSTQSGSEIQVSNYSIWLKQIGSIYF